MIKHLDTHLYGSYPEDTPALNYYWESIFYVDDDVAKPSNAQYTTYQSFLRRSLKLLYSEQAAKAVGDTSDDCKIPKQAVMKEVTLLRIADQFSGLVVTLKDAMSGDLHPPEFEVFFKPVSYLKKQTLNEEMARRIWSLEVCVCVCVRVCMCECVCVCVCVRARFINTSASCSSSLAVFLIYGCVSQLCKLYNRFVKTSEHSLHL